jgi:hypothetical protein
MEILQFLSTIPLFQELSSKHLQDLALIMTDQAVKRGQLIFSEGDEASGFYVVITGRIKIFKLSTEGKEQILHIFGPGEPIGEVPVFAGKRFPANAEALEDGKISGMNRVNGGSANAHFTIRILGIQTAGAHGAMLATGGVRSDRAGLHGSCSIKRGVHTVILGFFEHLCVRWTRKSSSPQRRFFAQQCFYSLAHFS